jgi:hypothetical protein
MADKYIRNSSGSLINTDNEEFKKYVMIRDRLKEQTCIKSNIENIKIELNLIKKTLFEIKELLNGNKS